MKRYRAATVFRFKNNEGFLSNLALDKSKPPCYNQYIKYLKPMRKRSSRQETPKRAAVGEKRCAECLWMDFRGRTESFFQVGSDGVRFRYHCAVYVCTRKVRKFSSEYVGGTADTFISSQCLMWHLGLFLFWKEWWYVYSLFTMAKGEFFFINFDKII